MGVFVLMLALGAICAPLPAAAQQGVVVVPGAEYRAAGIKARLLGKDYRDLWTTAIRVPVLDLSSFAGGLTPLRRGGGQQTTSLRFRGADGREYAFRSVNKIPGLARDRDLKEVLLGDLIQDQVSSIVPAAPLVAAPLAAAAGLLHAQPDIYVMPDDPALGEFRAEFAGMLGTLEERADESDDGGPGFGGLTRIVGTPTMLDELEENPHHQVDERAYLTARLLDLFMGDWDRHEDQWRWGRQEGSGRVVWIPIPRDRDYAFSNYDGLLLGIARRAVPNAVRFGPEYGRIQGTVLNAARLDRQLLAWLDRAAWDSVATILQARLTDEAIDEAVRRMPAEHYERRGEELSRVLRSRRDRLPAAAFEFYRHLSRLVEIRASDAAERAEVVRREDGSVEIVLAPLSATSGGGQSSRRVFDPAVTREIRLHLRGGDDQAVVRGSASRGILVRVIGGGGTDDLSDESVVARRGRWTSLHDSGDEGSLRGTRSTIVDRREYEAPERRRAALIRVPPPEIGTRTSVLPLLDYSTTIGLTLGARAARTRYGFRRHPHVSLHTADIRYSPRLSAFAAGVTAGFQSANPHLSSSLALRASQIDALRFYGFGNESPESGTEREMVVRRETASASAMLRLSPAEDLVFTAGPVVSYSRPWQEPGRPLAELRPRGWDGWSAWGLAAEMQAGRIVPSLADLEYGTRAGASAHLPISSGDSPYGSAHLTARLGKPLGPVKVDLRGGGELAWGDYPFHEAAFLGGLRNLRGFPEWRFAGDAAVFGSAESGIGLGRVPFILNWRSRAFVFMDAGRVFLDGESSDRWHSAPGGGLVFESLDYFIRLSYAHGAKGRIYLETRAAL